MLSFVNQANGQDLKELAEFCKLHVRRVGPFNTQISKSIENDVLARIISKLLKKVSKSLSAELVLYLRQVVIELIRKRQGKDLVEVFFDHASKEDRSVVLDYVVSEAMNLIFDIDSQ